MLVIKVYEVAPSLFMVDVRKATGDTLEYHKVSFLLHILYSFFSLETQMLMTKPIHKYPVSF